MNNAGVLSERIAPTLGAAGFAACVFLSATPSSLANVKYGEHLLEVQGNKVRNFNATLSRAGVNAKMSLSSVNSGTVLRSNELIEIQHSVTNFFDALLNGQEQVGTEFESIYWENAAELYVSL